ncbi:hypothetical protein EV644_14512 [Kribbella orskensis]|uniref:AMIN-like domain-containing protein n=1 Tax=Kribbella orskensis TaxID=2512216 RepID=A0ABY2B6X9_9ACTN|nr:hypothetical protein EV642_14812 [Kribbella sp. VKM Ac-2500]TCO08546.1 hypothetical protein EV644_14512 [Kribbella orskensis]
MIRVGFEGQATFGVGVRARLPFHTFTLSGPGRGSRLVIDITHRWWGIRCLRGPGGLRRVRMDVALYLRVWVRRPGFAH